LKAGARNCLGLDIDEATVTDAKATYKGCEFRQCDATALCVADNSIDLVVSFETIEHLRDQSKFLLECNRVLTPGGYLICSTPNRTMTRWAPDNPYHLHEFTIPEFETALRAVFADVQIFAQQNVNQLRYAGERLQSKTMHSLHHMNGAKRLLGRKSPAPAMRSEYGGVPVPPAYEVRPYLGGHWGQPRYTVAVARKSS
jgi:ubiquinone/menaquinone biosynthesis C-methylase UbiE